MNPDNYRPLVGDALIDELMKSVKSLAGARVCQINATAAGGGAAELLGEEIPILQAMGVNADWRLIHGDALFFEVTKVFHNALQGAHLDLAETTKQTYLDRDRACAEMIEGAYDVYVVHDPQPAALRHFAKPNQARWIWRCHIDSSEPNPHVWSFLKPFIEEYDAVVFTMKEFCPPDIRASRTVSFLRRSILSARKTWIFPKRSAKERLPIPASISIVPCFFKCPDLILGKIRWGLSRLIVW